MSFYIHESSYVEDNVNIADNVKIGNGVKIQNNVSVYRGVGLEDYVFCGPSMVFTNDITPRARYPKEKEEYERTLVKRDATIAAGAVVTHDVLPHALMAGISARQIGWICECGQVLKADFVCNDCKRKYKLGNNVLRYRGYLKAIPDACIGCVA